VLLTTVKITSGRPFNIPCESLTLAVSRCDFHSRNFINCTNISEIDNSSFERVEEFQYLGITLNQNPIQEEIKGRWKSGNAYYHSVQILLSSSLLSKNLKIKIYRTVILPFVLYGCETWSLTLRDEPRLRVFENRVLKRIFGPKRDEVTGEWGKLYNEELFDLHSSPNIVRVIKSRRMRWAGHVGCMGESELYTGVGGET